MRHPKHTLTIVYYFVLLLVVLAAMLGYYLIANKGYTIPRDSATATTIYSIVLWYVIITLPLSFVIFSRQLKKIHTIADTEQRYRPYTRLATIRLAVISLGLTAAILCYYLTQQMSLFWLAGIEAIGAIICKPTTIRINADLQSPEEENI